MSNTQVSGGQTPVTGKRGADVLSPTLLTPPAKENKAMRDEFVQAIILAFQDPIMEHHFQALMVKALQEELVKRDEKITALENKNRSLTNQINEMRTDMVQLHDKVDDLEQYGRRYSLRLHTAVQETEEEDTDAIVLETTKRLGLDVKREDISRSHRVGRKHPQHERKRPRPIIFRLISYRTRRLIYENRKKLPANVFLAEDLTQKRANLLYKCRQLRKSGVLRYVWTVDGRILVKEGHEHAQTIQIQNECDLARFGTIAPHPFNAFNTSNLSVVSSEL